MANQTPNISPDYSDIITVQQYGSGSTIEGVKIIDLQLHSDEGGEFVELGRLETGIFKSFPDFAVKQISWSRLLPGTIKAFHLHHHQADIWYVSPFDRILVGLADLRQDSPTYNTKLRLTLGGGTAKLLYIPKGVAHGAGNLWDHPATVVYFTSQAFNPASPDEGRLPYDLFGSDFWTLKQG